MKTTKRAISLMLAIMIAMTILAMPASAATISGINWTSEFQSFPQLYNGSTQNGYIKMLQRFLLVYPITYPSTMLVALMVVSMVDLGIAHRQPSNFSKLTHWVLVKRTGTLGQKPGVQLELDYT